MVKIHVIKENALILTEMQKHISLCGDKVHIYARLENNDKIEDLSFEGEGCAISLASASILTDTLKGKDIALTKRISENFLNMIKNKTKITLNSLTEDQVIQ